MNRLNHGILKEQEYNERYGFNVDYRVTVRGMYNRVASNYKTADRFGSISKSHQAAIEQVENYFSPPKPHTKVLDLGVGDAWFLDKLAPVLPDADFSGIDISPEMLELAQKRLPALTTIESSATEAEKHIPLHSQDLVLAHFINAYIPIHALFGQAYKMTQPNGCFSLITTTYDSFPKAQQMLSEFILEDSLLSRVVGHYYKNMVQNTTVASDQDHLLSVFADHQFTVISHQRLEVPICLNDIDALAQFGIEGTWFLNTLSLRMLPKNYLIQRLKKLFTRIFHFPYEDTHIIDIVLAKK